jgi:hypothetical protein
MAQNVAHESQWHQVDPYHLHHTQKNLPPVHINDIQLPQAEKIKYLGLHPACRLTWRNHIFAKGKQLVITLTKIYWLLGHQSKLTTICKLFAYKVVLKPIWTYGLQLWDTASTSNIEILEIFQSKTLRMITDAPWYVTNALLRRDLHIPSVKEEIQGLNSHPNLLTANFKKQPTNRRLRRILPTDLSTKYLV